MRSGQGSPHPTEGWRCSPHRLLVPHPVCAAKFFRPLFMNVCPVLKTAGKTGLCRENRHNYIWAARSQSDWGAVKYHRWYFLPSAMCPGAQGAATSPHPHQLTFRSRRWRGEPGPAACLRRRPESVDEGQREMVPTGASVSNYPGRTQHLLPQTGKTLSGRNRPPTPAPVRVTPPGLDSINTSAGVRDPQRGLRSLSFRRLGCQ